MKDSYVPILYTLQKTQKRKKYLDGFICITGRSLRVYDEKKRFLDSYSITAHTTLDDDVLELSKCLLQVEDEHRELLRSIASTSTPIHSNRSARTTPSKPKPSSVKTRTSHAVTSDIQTSSSQVVKPSSTKLSVPEPDKEILPVKTSSKSDLAKQPTQFLSFLNQFAYLLFWKSCLHTRAWVVVIFGFSTYIPQVDLSVHFNRESMRRCSLCRTSNHMGWTFTSFAAEPRTGRGTSAEKHLLQHICL